jgi:hypothetical protein
MTVSEFNNSFLRWLSIIVLYVISDMCLIKCDDHQRDLILHTVKYHHLLLNFVNCLCVFVIFIIKKDMTLANARFCLSSF